MEDANLKYVTIELFGSSTMTARFKSKFSEWERNNSRLFREVDLSRSQSGLIGDVHFPPECTNLLHIWSIHDPWLCISKYVN